MSFIHRPIAGYTNENNTMELTEKIRRFENFHILLWLIKDTCWMLEVKWLGALMVAPTLLMALIIVFKSRHTPEVLINLAILFWITANGFWMLMEFFFANAYKDFSAIPFALGFLCVGVFYYRSYSSKKN